MRALEEEALDALFASGSPSEGAVADGDARGAPFASGSPSEGASAAGDARDAPFASAVGAGAR